MSTLSESNAVSPAVNVFAGSRSRRRPSAFRPVVEAVERRTLLSLANFAAVGASVFPAFTNQPVVIQFEVQATGGTPVKVKSVKITDDSQTLVWKAKQLKTKIQKSTDHYETGTIKAKGKVVTQPGNCIVDLRIDNQNFTFTQQFEAASIF